MPRCIMIVDDDVDDIDIFIEAVHDVDPSIHCLSAQNGLDAINQIQASDILPNYIFVDMNMPKINGKQFTRDFRKNASFNDIKVIMYSTSKNDRDVKELKSLGANDFVQKPTSHQKLCSEIERIIANDL